METQVVSDSIYPIVDRGDTDLCTHYGQSLAHSPTSPKTVNGVQIKKIEKKTYAAPVFAGFGSTVDCARDANELLEGGPSTRSPMLSEGPLILPCMTLSSYDIWVLGLSLSKSSILAEQYGMFQSIRSRNTMEKQEMIICL